MQVSIILDENNNCVKYVCVYFLFVGGGLIVLQSLVIRACRCSRNGVVEVDG